MSFFRGFNFWKLSQYWVLALSGGIFAWLGMKLMSKATESVLIISMFGALFHAYRPNIVAYLYSKHPYFLVFAIIVSLAILAGFSPDIFRLSLFIM